MLIETQSKLQFEESIDLPEHPETFTPIGSGATTMAAVSFRPRPITLIPLATLAVAALFLNAWAFQYFTVDEAQYGIYWPRHNWLLAHVAAGSLALMLGPIQFWFAQRGVSRILHAFLGAGYVMSVSVGAVAALYLARHTDFGWIFGLGLTAMGVVWIMTTGLATIAIARKLREQHREWMIRSYVVTFGFVMFRIIVSVLGVAGVGTVPEEMIAASWLCWSVPLVMTEVVLQGRKIFSKQNVSASWST